MRIQNTKRLLLIGKKIYSSQPKNELLGWNVCVWSGILVVLWKKRCDDDVDKVKDELQTNWQAMMFQG